MFPDHSGVTGLDILFGGAKSDARFYGKPCLKITKGVPHAKAVTGSTDLDEIFDRHNRLFFKGRVKVKRICWTKRVRRSGNKEVWAANDYLNGEIRCSTNLLREIVPKGFLEFTVYHEMLHSVCPPKRIGADGHHAEFRKAELLFPKGKHYVELNKQASKALFEEKHPIYSLEEAGARYGLSKKHRKFLWDGVSYQIVGIIPSKRAYKVIAKITKTGEEVAFKPTDVKRAVEGAEAAYEPFSVGAERHGLSKKHQAFTFRSKKWKVFGYNHSNRRYKFYAKDSSGRVMRFSANQLKQAAAGTLKNPEASGPIPYRPDYLYEGVQGNPGPQPVGPIPYKPDYLYEGVAE
jgi:hypothetical protein